MPVVLTRAKRIEYLNDALRRDLRKKQHARDQYQARDDLVSVRRHEKSIALLVAKLLCPHPDVSFKVIMTRANGTKLHQLHCRDCKSSTNLNTVY